MKSFVAIIEARMNSSRLPGKILYKANKKTFLWHLIQRLKHIHQISKIILATTTNKSDDILESIAKKNKIHCFRGSELNVKRRVLDAAKKFKAEYIVGITSDCPILDVNIISQVIDTFDIHKVDFVSNSDFRSYPDGMDVSVYSYKALKKSYNLTKSKFYREHVTLFMKHNKKIFKQINIVAPKNIFLPKLGLTLDEYKDYILLKKIIEYFAKKKNYFFSCEEVVKILKKNQWLNINSKVIRKSIKYK
jgi:spore coat polysaccharide biosynthesis protein SpsF (cytidylyltransferase family)